MSLYWLQINDNKLFPNKWQSYFFVHLTINPWTLHTLLRRNSYWTVSGREVALPIVTWMIGCSFPSSLMISIILQYVPITSPMMPTMIRMMSFKTKKKFNLWFVYATQNSMMAGNAIPRADKHSAPKREMKRSKRGIATARQTANS